MKTLIQRAQMICSKSKLDDEIKFKSMTDLNKINPASVQRCLGYLRLL